jgi:hypothetical protein
VHICYVVSLVLCYSTIGVAEGPWSSGAWAGIVVGGEAGLMKMGGGNVVSTTDLGLKQSVKRGHFGGSIGCEASMVGKAVGLFEGLCTGMCARIAAVADGMWRLKQHPCKLANGIFG